MALSDAAAYSDDFEEGIVSSTIHSYASGASHNASGEFNKGNDTMRTRNSASSFSITSTNPSTHSDSDITLSESESNDENNDSEVSYTENLITISKASHSHTHNRSESDTDLTSDSYSMQFEGSERSKTSNKTADRYCSEFESDISKSGSQSHEHSTEQGYSSDFENRSVTDAHGSESDISKSSTATQHRTYQHRSDRSTTGASSTDSQHTQSSLSGDYSQQFYSNSSTSSRDSSKPCEVARRYPTLTPAQLEKQLDFCHAMRRVLDDNDETVERLASDDEVVIPFTIPEKKRKNYGPVNNFIASSLANIRESRLTEATPATPVSYYNMDTSRKPQARSLPANHAFRTRYERLRVENIITGMKQTSKKLTKEIDDHRKIAKQLRGDQNGREFALPRRNRLKQSENTAKFESHQTIMNSVNMIGIIAESLPKPTEKAEVIWNRLMNTAQHRIKTDGSPATVKHD